MSVTATVRCEAWVAKIFTENQHPWEGHFIWNRSYVSLRSTFNHPVFILCIQPCPKEVDGGNEVGPVGHTVARDWLDV